MSSDARPLIVYVDDDPTNLTVFEATFRREMRIVTFNSAEAALKKLPELRDVAAVLSDQRMPGMSGVTLLERSRELVPDAARMLVTAYSDMQAVIDAVNLGQVSRYFVKPWSREELLAALEDAIRVYVLQAKVRQMETLLLRSERLATIGQVSAGIAHELMNPVSYVTQNLAALRAEVGALLRHASSHGRPDAAVAEAILEVPRIVDDLEIGVKHIRQVALGIRDQARGDSAEASCDVAEVADFAARIARVEVRGRARVNVSGEQLRAAVSSVALCQVLLNLVINAGHAMEGRERPGRIDIHWSQAGDRVRIAVEDDGCGIPLELQERVFEPLFTTKPAGIGTGFGLAISRELVQRCGGEIRLRSEPNVGTTIELLLPNASP
jgi:signal transduction histidine kinase